MEGWTSVLDMKTDPRRDIYTFGVNPWEIACDGRNPSHPLEPVKKEEIDELVKECITEEASSRIHLRHIFDTLGEIVKCGC